MWSAPSFAGRGNFEDLPGDGRAGYPEDQADRRGTACTAADASAGGKTENMPGIEKVTLTTNGVLLKDQMSDLPGRGWTD